MQTLPLPSAASFIFFTISHALTLINASHTDACTLINIFINTNNLTSVPLKVSVIRGLQKAPVILTSKLKSTLNINKKHSASFIKTDGNCTPLSIINNNERVKCSIIKSLKQQVIEAEAE